MEIPIYLSKKPICPKLRKPIITRYTQAAIKYYGQGRQELGGGHRLTYHSGGVLPVPLSDG